MGRAVARVVRVGEVFSRRHKVPLLSGLVGSLRSCKGREPLVHTASRPSAHGLGGQTGEAGQDDTAAAIGTDSQMDWILTLCIQENIHNVHTEYLHVFNGRAGCLGCVPGWILAGRVGGWGAGSTRGPPPPSTVGRPNSTPKPPDSCEKRHPIRIQPPASGQARHETLPVITSARLH